MHDIDYRIGYFHHKIKIEISMTHKHWLISTINTNIQSMFSIYVISHGQLNQNAFVSRFRCTENRISNNKLPIETISTTFSHGSENIS